MSEREGFWNPRQSLLKVLSRYLLGLTLSELQHGGSSSKGTRDIGRGTELSGFRMRAGEGSFLQDWGASRGHCSMENIVNTILITMYGVRWVLDLSG